MPATPKFTKTSPEVVERFQSALARHAAPDITVKPMFGYQCAWLAATC